MASKRNKNEIIDKIAAETGLSRNDVGAVINSFIQTIKESLMQGHKVLLKGFITFSVKEAGPRSVNDFKGVGTTRQIGKRFLPKAKFSYLFAQKIKKK